MAQGRPERLTNAKYTFIKVLIGVALFLGAWFLGQVLLNTLGSVIPGLFTDVGNACG